MHPRETVMPIARVAGVRGSFIGHKRRQGAVIRRAAGFAARKRGAGSHGRTFVVGRYLPAANAIPEGFLQRYEK
jgi:hypothetical protein